MKAPGGAVREPADGASSRSSGGRDDVRIAGLRSGRVGGTQSRSRELFVIVVVR
jgi:hypothetical protein